MKCPQCQHDNPQGARFCNACGTALALRCAACGHENPPRSRFCGQCAQALAPGAAVAPPPAAPAADVAVPKYLAEKILASRCALEGERKQVTVLFADMKGSMELLAGRDPEDARKVLDPLLEHMMDAVHRFEGTVNQVMGDGIMALFGAPIAHEDHAVRACYAALRMQERVTQYSEALRRSGASPVQIRVGLNSGEVVVRSIGSDLRMDYSAVGQTTHLAARMEQLATPGSTLITAETLRLAEGYVRVDPLGCIPVAGLREPVESYQLSGVGSARTRLQATVARGLGKFVGRAAELDTLDRAIEAAGQGHGQIVAAVGEAGVGKSRLFHEFVHSHHTQGWLVLEAGSVSYGKATGYLPVIDLLESYFAIEDRDDARRMRERVTGKLLALDRSLEPALPALLALLDVSPDDSAWQSLDPRQRRQAILDALKRLVLRECQVQPIVLVFEDLHWVDSESQAVLDMLVESLPAARMLLLVNYRPEARHEWGQKTYYQQIRLDALPRESAEELLDALLGQAPELRHLRQQLIERTEGNPLFLEECVSTLMATGALVGDRGSCRLGRAVETIQVPATVQAILAARIDRLAGDDKHVLQAAAVIGKDVPGALLQAIAGLPENILGSTIGRLQAAELLYEATLFPDIEYTFKHALTHEVSYAGLLGDRRRELHARVVGAIETVYQDRIGEHAERLAHHASRGGLKEKAVRYLKEAGNKAVMRSAFREAIGFFEEGLTLAAQLPQTRETQLQTLALHTGLGPALMAIRGSWTAEVETCYSKALELCDQLGEASDRFAALFGLWYCHHSRGEYERARQLTTELLVLAADAHESLRLEAHHAMWSTSIGMGRPAEAVKHLEQGRRLYRVDERSPWWIFGNHDPGVCCDEMGALGSWLLGHFDQARQRVVNGVQLAKRLRHPFSTLIANALAAVVYYHCGERGAAKLHAQAASALGHAHGFAPQWPQFAAVLLARLLVEEGRTQEAIELARKNLPDPARTGWTWGCAMSFGLTADAYGRAGQADKGLQMLRALDPKCYDGLYGPELHRLYAELLLAGPHATDEAENRLQSAISLARERQMKALELRASMSWARLLAQRDRRAARDALSVIDSFKEGFDTADLRTAKALREWLA